MPVFQPKCTSTTFIFVYSTNQAIFKPTVILLLSRPFPRSVIAVSAVTSNWLKYITLF
uniref:Uncharacterized protein n=1 Tax=Romanomermis culicivorax TaxID=13658 RepID=A0A915JWU8_ROMCU